MNMQQNVREEPTPAYLARLLEFMQDKAERMVGEGRAHPPILVLARVDPQTNDPEFVGTSQMSMTEPTLIENHKKGDLDALGPAIKHALTTRACDVAVFVAEGWCAVCHSEAEARAVQESGPDGIKAHSEGRSAVIISLYTRDAEYAVVNDITEPGTGKKRTMQRAEIDWEQEFHGGMSIHGAKKLPFASAADLAVPNIEHDSDNGAVVFKGIFHHKGKKTLH